MATPMEEKTVIGINFGDSFASIAVINKESQAECIANEDGERQIACAISYHGEEEYIGNVALPHLVKNSENTIIHFRNLLGKKFSSITPSESPISSPILAGPDDVPGYKVTILVPPAPTPAKSTSATPIGTPRPSSPRPLEKAITVPEANTIFLKSILQSAVDFLGKPVDGAVISVPTWFDKDARKALKAAAEDAGIKVLQLLEEPGAVALAYMNLSERAVIMEDRTSLVVDLGANSLNLSLLSLSQGLVHSLANLHDLTVGGSTIDTILITHFAKEFTKKTKVPLSFPGKTPEDKRAEAKMRLAVEHTKRTLSASPGAATCSVESLKDGMDFSGAITRLRFDLLVSSVYKRVAEKVLELLKQANIDIVWVDEILLVGASAALPGLVDELQSSVVGTEDEGATVIRSDLETFEVIARGAALHAQLVVSVPEEDIAPEFAEDSELAEVQATSGNETIGLAFPSESGEKKWIGIVNPETPLPCRRILRLEADPSVSKTIGFEVWTAKNIVKVEKSDMPKLDGDEDEEDEPEEIRSRDVEYHKALGGLSLDLVATKRVKVLVKAEVSVDGQLEVKLWEEGKQDAGKTLTVPAP